jgi:hypothetical protein
MATRLSDMIHEWMGWCPDADMAKAQQRSNDKHGLSKAGLLVSDNGFSGSGQPVKPWDLRYDHTQQGYLLLGAVGGAGLIIFLTLIMFGPEPVSLIVLCILVFVLAIMSRLTVSVSDDSLRIRFGPVGLVHKMWPLKEIISATAVSNPWYYGYGIRWTPHGPLYNVSGRHAVEILLKSGKKVRIGTDEPDALAGAINHAIR